MHISLLLKKGLLGRRLQKSYQVFCNVFGMVMPSRDDCRRSEGFHL